MSDINCKWVEEHLEEYAAGELPSKVLSSVELHIAGCESCAESLRIWNGLVELVPSGELPMLDERVEERLLSGVEPDSAGRSSKPSKAALAGLGIAAAAVLAIGVAVFGDMLKGEDRAKQPPVTDQLTQDDRPSHREDATPRRDAAGRRVIPVLPGTSLFLSEDARVEITSLSSKMAEFKLLEGMAVAEIGPVPPSFRFIVTTPKDRVEARGTVFSVLVDESGSSKVRVSQGRVTVDRLNDPKETVLLEAGEQLNTAVGFKESTPAALASFDMDIVLKDSPVSPPEIADTQDHRPVSPAGTSTGTMKISSAVEKDTNGTDKPEEASSGGADALLLQAREHRNRKEFSSAAAVYEHLIETYPQSSAKGIAMVSLGQLRLNALKSPAAAVKHFEAYLSQQPSGGLTAEALAGKVRCHAKLGDHQNTLETAKRYLLRHPRGRAAAEMHRRRGEAFIAVGNRSAAKEEFNLVISDWPDSYEAARARTGLDELGELP